MDAGCPRDGTVATTLDRELAFIFSEKRNRTGDLLCRVWQKDALGIEELRSRCTNQQGGLPKDKGKRDLTPKVVVFIGIGRGGRRMNLSLECLIQKIALPS